MKKLFLTLISVIAFVGITRADDAKPINVAELPVVARQFIDTHFKGEEIALANVSKKLFFVDDYEVVFVNGTKLEFDKKGNWTEVSCQHTQVPEKIVPQKIAQFIAKKYSNAKVLQIEIDEYSNYELELSNKAELKFDKKFNLIGIDF